MNNIRLILIQVYFYLSVAMTEVVLTKIDDDDNEEEEEEEPPPLSAMARAPKSPSAPGVPSVDPPSKPSFTCALASSVDVLVVKASKSEETKNNTILLLPILARAPEQINRLLIKHSRAPTG